MKVKSMLVAAAAAIAVGAVSLANAAVITIASSNVPKSIPDNQPAGITSTLNFSGIGNITDVNLILGSVVHTSVPDLHIELWSPSGLHVTLIKAFTENGILVGLGTPDNFTNTVLDDQAPTNLRNGAQPYTGSFNVDHASVGAAPLSAFNGLNATGIWTLFISDLATADVGTLQAWSLQITGNATAVAEPVSMALLGVGLLGLAAVRRRRAV